MTIDDLQTIIFAAGKGHRIAQLTHNKPKCLLTIGAKPMIQYPLEMLIRSGIKETYMLVLDTEEERIKTTINALALQITVKYVKTPSISESTADSFRIFKRIQNDSKETIYKDFLIIPCDIITDYDLKHFIRFYRTCNPSFLCLLTDIGSEKENLVPAVKLNNHKESELIGIDVKEPNRLVLFEPEADSKCDNGGNFPLSKSMVQQCPNFKMSTKMNDSHIYLFKNWILDYLVYKKNIASIKTELVPSLVRKQFRRSHHRHNDSDADKKDAKNHFMDFVQSSKLDQILEKLDSGDLEAVPKPQCYPKNKAPCYQLTVKSGYCIRVNSWIGFCEANRVMLKQRTPAEKPARTEAIKSHVDGFVGTGTAIGTKCTVKRTVIGANCKIGEHVKLTNCIILDNVTIEDGAVLNNTVVCSKAIIGNKSELKDCIVGPGQTLHTLSQFTNESITESRFDENYEDDV